uniref:Uncharacterized protein n=1 Tax=Ciona intestinalis TaxID=7719 RepID=F6XSW3_CIOIN
SWRSRLCVIPGPERKPRVAGFLKQVFPRGPIWRRHIDQLRVRYGSDDDLQPVEEEEHFLQAPSREVHTVRTIQRRTTHERFYLRLRGVVDTPAGTPPTGSHLHAVAT